MNVFNKIGVQNKSTSRTLGGRKRTECLRGTCLGTRSEGHMKGKMEVVDRDLDHV